jgi:ferritin-like protein
VNIDATTSDEINQIKELINRTLELGGKLTTNIMGTSTCGFSEPPQYYSDLVRIMEPVLEGERCAIEKYNKLAKNTI